MSISGSVKFVIFKTLIVNIFHFYVSGFWCVLVKLTKSQKKSQKITGEYKLHEHTLLKDDTGQIIKQLIQFKESKTKICQKIQSKCI